MLSHCSPVRLLVTPWTVAHQAPLSMGFSRQEYWSGFPCSPSGDFPDPDMEFTSATAPALQEDSLPLSENRSCIHETHFNYEDSQLVKNKDREAQTSIYLLLINSNQKSSFYFTFIYFFF